MAAPTQDVLDMFAVNAPQNAGSEAVRLPDHAAR